MSTNKLDLIREIQYHNNFEKLAETLTSWSKKSNNEELKKCKGYLSEIGIYVALLEMNIKTARIAVKDYQARTLKANNRVLKMNEEIKELKNKINTHQKEIIENFDSNLNN